MTNHLVLIFAYHYPPENAIGGVRPFRFAKYLSRLGYTCHIFTAADQAGRDDPNVKYVSDPFVSDSRRHLSRQVERAIRKFFLPGEVGMQWSYHAAQAARVHIRARSYDRVTIFSTFPPLGSHLAGWQLARGNRMVWIADCRDTMSGEYGDEPRAQSQRRVYGWLERTIARRADAVIANTDAALDDWKERFPASNHKIHLIWNGFDPEERLTALPVCLHDCKTVSHVGELYHGRSATPVLESVARLIAAKRVGAGNVCVRLIGPADAECLPAPDFLQRAKLEGWLDLVNERIPLHEAHQVSQRSGGLLLIQPRATDAVPAKIFEYLQIGRPILAFVTRNSPAERLLSGSGLPYRCVYPDSTPEDTDDTVAAFFKLSSQPTAASRWFEDQFNAEHQTRALDSIIRSLHSEQPGRELHAAIPHSEHRHAASGHAAEPAQFRERHP